MILAILWATIQPLAAFDHQHSAWNDLLKAHVVWIEEGRASRVNYYDFQKDRSKLERYLDTLSSVSRKTFDAWAKDDQLSFLINAYNAYTVKLILSKYPDLKSIKEMGSFLSGPWKKKFFTLFGQLMHLDGVEQDLIREKGKYDEPRIHMAVVCASIGCPALRNEAFTGDRLDEQLEDSLERFLSDRSRNRYNETTGIIEVSRIFDWYESDFKSGYRGFTSLNEFFARHAQFLTENPDAIKKIQEKTVKIKFLSYDWNLNSL